MDGQHAEPELMQNRNFDDVTKACGWLPFVGLRFRIATRPLGRAALIAVASMAIGSTGNLISAQDIETEYRLAASFYARSQWNLSESAFEEIIQRYPESRRLPLAQFYLGESRVQQADHVAAIAAFEQFLLSDPDHSFAGRAEFRIGESADAIGDKDKAVRALERFVRDFPDHELVSNALTLLGNIRLQRQEPSLAKRVFETGLELFPNSDSSFANRLGLAHSYQMLGQDDEAIRLLQHVVDGRDQKSAISAKVSLARLLGQQERDSEVIALIGETAASRGWLKGCDSAARRSAESVLATSLTRTGQSENAESIYKSMVEQSDGAEASALVWLEAAKTARESGELQSAARFADRVINQQQATAQTREAAWLMRIDLLDQRSEHQCLSDAASQFAIEFPASEHRFDVAELAGRAAIALDDHAAATETFSQLVTQVEQSEKGTGRTEQSKTRLANYRYLLALSLMRQQKFVAAKAQLDVVNAIDAESTRSLVPAALATASFESGDWGEAERLFNCCLESANATTPATAVANLQMRRCISQAKQGNWNEVAAWLPTATENLIVEDSVCQRYQQLAAIARQDEQTEIARPMYRRLLNDARPHVAEAGLTGLSLIEINEPADDRTRDIYERLIEQHTDAKFALTTAMARADWLQRNGSVNAARDMFERVIEASPESPSAQVARMRLVWLLQSSEDRSDLQIARAHLEQLSKASGGAETAEALYLRGLVQHQLGDSETATQAFRKLADQTDNNRYQPDAIYRLAAIAAEANDRDNADQWLKKLFDNPTTPIDKQISGWELAAKTSTAEKDWARTEHAMTQIVRLSDEPAAIAKAQYWVGESRYQQERFEDAIAVLQRLDEHSTSLPPAIAPWVSLRLAQSLGKLNRWEDANVVANTAREAFQVFPARCEFDYLIGRAAEDNSDFETATTIYQRLIDNDVDHESEIAAIAQWRIGEMRFHQERYADAIQAYHRVETLYPFAEWRSVSLLQAAKCQEHLGNWKHAAALYQALIEEFPESELATDARSRLNRVNQMANADAPSIQR